MNNRDNSAAPDPAALVLRIRNGDHAAEEELARCYGPRLEFILRRHARDPALATDLRQETLLIVIQRLRKTGLDEPDKLAAFMHRTALNLARGEARTHYRRNTHPDFEAIELAAAAEPPMVDRIARAQLSDMISQLLTELKQPRDQQLLRRFYLGEESKASICTSLDVTPAHFDRVLYRARQRFRQILETRLGPEWRGG